MTLARRLTEAEDNLTPREAMSRWMREAHGFGSYGSYARWLIDQPDDVYPLIRMPRQVVSAVRAQRKGVPDLKLQGEFHRVQKDLLFLYFLHKQVNMRALLDHEALQLRGVIMVKEMRALINEKHGLDQMRLLRVDLEGKKHPRPDKAEKRTKARYQAHVEAWPPQAEEVLARVLTYLEAVQLVSRRYFAGEDILYPDTRENLSRNLTNVATMKELYTDAILEGSPESDDDFRDYVLALNGDARGKEKGQPSVPAREGPSQFASEARRLAEQWILMARSEALGELGEHQEAEVLAEKLIRETL